MRDPFSSTHDQRSNNADNVRGLGLNFFIQFKHPKRVVIALQTASKLKRDVRLKHHFTGSKINKCDKKVHVKSTWEPPQAAPHLELMIDSFVQQIERERKIIQHRPPATNLSTRQLHQLSPLRHKMEIVIVICYKNLDPVIIDRGAYIKSVLAQHLQDNKGTYRRIATTEFTTRSVTISKEISNIIKGRLHKDDDILSKKFECQIISKTTVLQYV